MIVFNDYLVKRLPDYIIERDSYKDINQKGFVQRYVGMLGLELDEEIYNKLEELPDQWDPRTVANPEYINYFAVMLGDLPRLLDDEYNYSSILLYIVSIYRIKGTINSYKALLGALGHTTVTIAEIDNSSVIYDLTPSPLLYDAPGVIYDDNCRSCSFYQILLTTSLPVTGVNYQSVIVAASLLEPLGAQLLSVSWNGDTVNGVYIEVYIDPDGNLFYDNAADPGLILTLVNGDLIISGPNAVKYYLDGGNLYYVD
jgi:hypothetical protein